MVALSADGSTLVAGAPGNVSAFTGRGLVDVYTKPAGGWASSDTPTATLTNAAGADGDLLGTVVALSADGGTLVAGARLNDTGGTDRGAAYLYTKPAGGWASSSAPTATLTAAGGADGDFLGFAVALSADGRTLVAGAPYNAAGGKYRGAVYAFANLSTNASLSGLALSQGTLSPAFVSATSAYAALVENTISSITVTPTLADSTATVTVNGTPVSAGSASGPISLTVGTNVITVIVTAQDGTTRTTSTITVTRATRSFMVWLPVILR